MIALVMLATGGIVAVNIPISININFYSCYFESTCMRFQQIIVDISPNEAKLLTGFRRSQPIHSIHKSRDHLLVPSLRVVLNLFARYAGNAASFQEDFDERFEKYAKFGFNVLFMTKGLPPGQKLGWGEVGDGVGHTTTRYGEAESDDRKKSLGVFYRNWHPGPLGFQVSTMTQ